MNNKGFLLGEETLKIIIAVISITFLVYLLVSLYNAGRKSAELEQAEASLEHLIQEINSGSKEVQIYNPKGWWIISWPHDVNIPSGFLNLGRTLMVDALPNSCSNLGWESCLCVCKKVNPEECDEGGVCRESDFFIDERSENKIKIQKPPVDLIISQEDKSLRLGV